MVFGIFLRFFHFNFSSFYWIFMWSFHCFFPSVNMIRNNSWVNFFTILLIFTLFCYIHGNIKPKNQFEERTQKIEFNNQRGFVWVKIFLAPCAFSGWKLSPESGKLIEPKSAGEKGIFLVWLMSFPPTFSSHLHKFYKTIFFGFKNFHFQFYPQPIFVIISSRFSLRFIGLRIRLKNCS